MAGTKKKTTATTKKKPSKPASSRAAPKKPAASPAKVTRPDAKAAAPSKPKIAPNTMTSPALENTEPVADYEVVKPPQPVDLKHGSGFLIILLFIAVAGIGTYATWSLWSPYVAPHFPALSYKPDIDPRLARLVGRMDALEAQSSSGVVKSATIGDMEKQREHLQEKVGRLLSRLDSLENTIDDVKQLAVATGVKEPSREAKQVIAEISARLKELEKSGVGVGTLTERIDQLESVAAQDSDDVERLTREAKSELGSMIGKLEDRLTSLESTETASPTSKMQASAIILAVSQLRKAAVSGQPFANDIEALRAMSQNHPDMQAALLVLEKIAIKGAATIVGLRNQFSELADDLVRAGTASDAESGWFEQAKGRILSLVSIRKTGSDSGFVSVGSLVELAQEHLRQGDVATAVKVVEKLKSVSDPAAKLAEIWLRDAKDRLKTERAVASLHVYAVSLVAAGGS